MSAQRRPMGSQGLKKYNRDVAVALLTAMYEDDADFTNTFRGLSGVSTGGADDLPASLAEVWHPPGYHKFHRSSSQDAVTLPLHVCQRSGVLPHATGASLACDRPYKNIRICLQLRVHS